MKISLIQFNIAWEDKSQNFRLLGELLTPLRNKTDVVVLPEMFNTGFSIQPEHLSESPSGETLRWMKSTAENGNFGLCGSYIVRDGSKFYNRWLFVSPDGDTWSYDKRHLFSMGGEDRFFSAGKSRLIFTFRGVRISPYVCYDLRFPVWSRSRNEYDLLINSANWPESRISVWNTLIKARAIENQCYAAGVNRIGIDGAGIRYCGDSMIINPRGEVIASSAMNEENVITGEISMTDLSELRNKFPVSDDADDFTIIQ